MGSNFNLCLCESCSLNHPERGINKIPAWLTDHPKFSILGRQWNVLRVGQAPGEVENTLKRPFCGPAGKMLWRLDMEAGLERDRLPMTNIVACWPPDDRAPTGKEMACCYGRLKDEIHQAKPELMVAFGGPALSHLTGKSGIESHRGQFFDLLPDYDYPCKVLALYHPSFIMRQRHWIATAVEDLKLIQSFFIDGPRVEYMDEIAPKMYLNPSEGELKEFLSRVKKEDVLIFDLETTGLNPRQDKVIGQAYCFNPYEALSVCLTEEDPRWEVIKQVQEDKSVKKGVQNGSFDYGMLRPLGIKTENIYWDTRLAETLIHPDMPKNLQAMRAYYTNIPPYKPSSKEMASIQSWPKEKMMRMGCMDVLSTYAVMQGQKPLLSEKEHKLQQDLLLPLIEVFCEMEGRGMKVNVDTLASMYGREFPKLEELRASIEEEIGINPASPKQIKEKYNLPDAQEDTLTYHIKRNEYADIFQKIINFRKKQKGLSTYLKGIYERLEDGRIHTTYKIEGTGTGRPSSSDPNLANVPEPFRVIYTPDDPDHVFIETDFSQLELRVGGLIAPEPLILREMADGIDPHERTRIKIYGEEEKPRQRLITKAVVFGTLYGRSARSIAIEFGITVAEAEHIQSVCINRYPGFLAYKKRCERQVLDNGVLETPFGRRRVVTTITQGYNTPIQSTAADVGLTTLLRLYRAGFDLRITVYDSFLIHARRSDYKEVVREIKKVCEEPYELFHGYLFPTKSKWGDNWADLEAI